MTDPREGWLWGASAVRTGTNEPMHETAATKAELDVKLFGCAYAADRASVSYYRYPPPARD